MRATINDIAKKCNVSIATVSRVLNNIGPVKESTRRSVLRVAKELHYKPNPMARGLSRKKTDTIGVILPELVDEFFMDIIHGLDEVAHRYQRYLLISSSHSQRNDIETILEFMGSGRVDGVILMAPGLDDEIFNIIHKSKRPLILLNCFKGGEGLVSIGIDNYNSAREITRHLIGHGYQRFGMVTGPENNVEAVLRLNGFKDELAAHGIPYCKNDVIAGDFTLRSGYKGFVNLMNQPDRVRAIFMANDMMALGAYQAAQKLNIRIPHDVAIAGFDDIFSSSIVNPRLTTMHIPVMDLGRKAIEYLIKLIDQEIDPETTYREQLPARLVIGGSCGCIEYMHSEKIFNEAS